MFALPFPWKGCATIAICSIAIAAAGRFSAQLGTPLNVPISSDVPAPSYVPTENLPEWRNSPCLDNQPCAQPPPEEYEYGTCSNGTEYVLSIDGEPFHYEIDPCVIQSHAEAIAISTDGETVAFLVSRQQNNIGNVTLPTGLFFAHWKTGDAWEVDVSADVPDSITPDMRFVAYAGPRSMSPYTVSYVVVDLQTGERDVIVTDPLREDPALELKIRSVAQIAGRLSISTDGRYLYAPYSYEEFDMGLWVRSRAPGVVYDRQERKFFVVGHLRNGEEEPAGEPFERIMLSDHRRLIRYADGEFGTIGGWFYSIDGKAHVVANPASLSIEMARRIENDGLYKTEIRTITSRGRYSTMSDDGFSVAYVSDREAAAVYDWNTQETKKLSFGEPLISGDGRFIAGTTTAALVPEDTDDYSDVYVYDRESGNYTLVIWDVMPEAPQDDVAPTVYPEFAPAPPASEEYGLPSTSVDSVDSPLPTGIMPPSWAEVHPAYSPESYTPAQPGDDVATYQAAPQWWEDGQGESSDGWLWQESDSSAGQSSTEPSEQVPDDWQDSSVGFAELGDGADTSFVDGEQQQQQAAVPRLIGLVSGWFGISSPGYTGPYFVVCSLARQDAIEDANLRCPTDGMLRTSTISCRAMGGNVVGGCTFQNETVAWTPYASTLPFLSDMWGHCSVRRRYTAICYHDPNRPPLPDL